MTERRVSHREETDASVKFSTQDMEDGAVSRTSAAPRIGCLWRKRNLTELRCPTTSRPRDSPRRNKRRT